LTSGQRVNQLRLCRRPNCYEIRRRGIGADGNKEIGSALFISEGTVKSHVKAIFAKMNVISRTEAVASAMRRSLIQL